MAVVCPECDNPITIDTEEAEEGEIVQCDECGSDLEIVSIDPLQIKVENLLHLPLTMPRNIDEPEVFDKQIFAVREHFLIQKRTFGCESFFKEIDRLSDGRHFDLMVAPDRA